MCVFEMIGCLANIIHPPKHRPNVHRLYNISSDKKVLRLNSDGISVSKLIQSARTKSTNSRLPKGTEQTSASRIFMVEQNEHPRQDYSWGPEAKGAIGRQRKFVLQHRDTSFHV